VTRRVLIVDDHPGFRSWTRSLLESEGYLVVGEAADGASAVAAARELCPDLVLLDVMLPDMSGFAVTEHLLALESPPLVVLVSSRTSDDYGAAIAASRARGFISKLDLTGSRLREVLAGPS
jgi:DNA-binding NarL/FixJ family response regulator